MAKSKKQPAKKGKPKKEITLKIHGTLDDVLRASVAPKKPKKN